MMVTQYSNLVSFQDLFPESTDHFLEPFRHIVDPDITNGMHLPFILSEKQRDQKLSPILQLAQPTNAQEIVHIYKQIYKGTYPYKEMESVEEVTQMIQDPHYEWLLFKTPTGQIAGCFTYELDFDHKRGYMRGFNINPTYQGILDAVKAVVGSMIGIWSQYRDRICHWYCENRTAHTKSQYLSAVCGINPIAFFPNKDVFFGKVESDIMHIAYNSKALTKYRSHQVPHIIPSVKPCFTYSQEKYQLESCEISHPTISLDKHLLRKAETQLEVHITKSPFKYETITYSIDGDSFFQFLYTPQVNNFEKMKYRVKNCEELYVFLNTIGKIIYEWNIRYAECFVSAYNPAHQQLFYNQGFRPRGYVPSWHFTQQHGSFADAVVFNWYKGDLATPRLIDQGMSLFNSLN